MLWRIQYFFIVVLVIYCLSASAAPVDNSLTPDIVWPPLPASTALPQTTSQYALRIPIISNSPLNPPVVANRPRRPSFSTTPEELLKGDTLPGPLSNLASSLPPVLPSSSSSSPPQLNFEQEDQFNSDKFDKKLVVIDGEDVVLSSPKPSSSPPPPSIESLSSSSTSTSNSQSSAWEYWARLKSPPFLDDDQDGDEDNDNYDDNDSVDNSNSEKSLSRPGSIVIQDDDDESTNDREERFLRMLGPAFSKYDVEFMHRFADYAKEVDNEKVWDVLDTMDALMHDIVGWRCQLLQNYQELRLISPAFCSYNTPKKRAGADDNIFVTASSSSLENTGQLPPTRKLRNKFHVGDQRHIRWQACYNNYTKCSKLTEEKILLATRLFFELKAWEEGGRGVTGSVRSAIHNR